MTKSRKCKVCEVDFVPFNTTDKVCSVKCAIEKVKQDNAIKQAKAWRKEKLERKRALKTKSEWIKDCQADFNAYIRFRDRHENCISGGKFYDDSKLYQGSGWDCGHYRSIGSCPELRFHPMNAHKQSVHHNRDLSGNHVEYRKHLINRIGLANVEWLEGPHQAQHWDITDIQEIRAWYKEQLKYLKQDENG